MSKFIIHDENTAPDAAKETLEKAKQQNGRIPGLYGVMADAPGLLDTYIFTHQQFMKTSLTDEEKTVVWQAINVEQNCHYCVPAHTGIAKMMKVDDAITDALRDETALPNAKLEALRTFTLTVVRNRGEVAEADLQAFFAAGYSERNVLEIILGLAQKVMSNYTNHFAKTPVDKVFEKFAWTKSQEAAE